MPYIKLGQRYLLDNAIDNLIKEIVNTRKHGGDTLACVGILNYCITRLVLQVFARVFPKRSYWQFPLIKGLLTDIGDEISVRLQRPYEDEKKEDNGDLEEFS
jgi:hypothetical protein